MSRIAHRLAATAAVCGAALAVTVLPAAAADHGRHHETRPHVVLGQVHYDGPGARDGSQRSLNEEWVTVTNTSSRAADLDGWTLTSTDHGTYRFHRLWLGGHRSVRVHSGVGRDTGRDVYQDRRGYVRDNRGGTATLRDDRGRVVDSESWGRQDRDGGRGHGGVGSRSGDDGDRHRGDRDHGDRGDRGDHGDHGDRGDHGRRD